jgi:hypothetical protein
MPYHAVNRKFGGCMFQGQDPGAMCVISVPRVLLKVV